MEDDLHVCVIVLHTVVAEDRDMVRLFRQRQIGIFFLQRFFEKGDLEISAAPKAGEDLCLLCLVETGKQDLRNIFREIPDDSLQFLVVADDRDLPATEGRFRTVRSPGRDFVRLVPVGRKLRKIPVFREHQDPVPFLYDGFRRRIEHDGPVVQDACRNAGICVDDQLQEGDAVRLREVQQIEFGALEVEDLLESLGETALGAGVGDHLCQDDIRLDGGNVVALHEGGRETVFDPRQDRTDPDGAVFLFFYEV